MKSSMKMIAALILIFFLGACTHSLHVAHISDFSPSYAPYGKGQLVTSKAEQFTVMGWVNQTDYVNVAHQKLLDQCTGGTIQGLSTQYSTDHGFFSWTNRIEMQGLCVR